MSSFYSFIKKIEVWKSSFIQYKLADSYENTPPPLIFKEIGLKNSAAENYCV